MRRKRSKKMRRKRKRLRGPKISVHSKHDKAKALRKVKKIQANIKKNIRELGVLSHMFD